MDSLIASPDWTEHFTSEVGEIQPPFLSADFQTPFDLYVHVRELVALGFSYSIAHPWLRSYPPLQALQLFSSSQFLPMEPFVAKLDNPLPMAISCQIALLWALLGYETEAASLAATLEPLIRYEFTSLWTAEREYEEGEARLSCALLLFALGKGEQANQLYHPSLPKDRFFAWLFEKDVKIASLPSQDLGQALDCDLYSHRSQNLDLGSARRSPIEAQRSDRGGSFPVGKGDDEDRLGEVIASPNPSFGADVSIIEGVHCTYAITLNQNRMQAGALRSGAVMIPAFGPHSYPLSNPNLFGMKQIEAKDGWFSSASAKDAWFQVVPLESDAFSLQCIGVEPENPVYFVFYVRAQDCIINGRQFKPKSLLRFSGEAEGVQFQQGLDRLQIETDRPLSVELIPLSGGDTFWGASFLLAYRVPSIVGRIGFQMKKST